MPNPDDCFFVGVSGPWIRLRTPEGEILTSGRESSETERRRADKAEAELQALGRHPIDLFCTPTFSGATITR